MGDVKGGPAFTHLSYDDYRILRANLVGGEKASTRDRIVPYTMFIDPQLGRVGLTERQAREQDRAVRVAKLPMNAVIRAIETGETRGFMKVVIDADTRQILGAAVLGTEGGEIMTIIQVAMMGELPYTAMANAIFSHPLLAEGLNSLFLALRRLSARTSHGLPPRRLISSSVVMPYRNRKRSVATSAVPSPRLGTAPGDLAGSARWLGGRVTESPPAWSIMSG